MHVEKGNRAAMPELGQKACTFSAWHMIIFGSVIHPAALHGPFRSLKLKSNKNIKAFILPFFFLPFHRLCVLVKVKGLAASEIEFLNTYAVQVYFRQMLSFSDCPASDLNPDLEGQLNLL